MKACERRYIQDSELRITNEGKTLSGHAAVFNKWSEDLGFFREKIRTGAFSKTIGQNRTIKALINHDPNLVIGSSNNNTLRLWEDDIGLAFEINLPDTSYAKDLAESVRRGDITQNSFGFLVVQDSWKQGEGKELDERELIEVRLLDVSPVTFPAYTQTDLSIRYANVGIDFESLGDALSRSVNGKAAWKQDIATLRKTIEYLQGILRKDSPKLTVEYLQKKLDQVYEIENLSKDFLN